MISLSCGHSGIGRKSTLDGRLAAERWFDPLNHPGDTVLVTGKNPGRGSESGSTKSAASLPDSSNTIAHEFPDTTNEIFRVQIYASKSLDDAKEYIKVVENLFPEGVFLEYEAPYYKVRLGEYYNFKSGQAFLAKVKDMGFENAWLVRVKK